MMLLQGAIQMFREGGFGMYPTLGFGLWAIGETIRQSRSSAPIYRASFALVAATLLAGCLGTITGMIKSMTYAIPYPPEERLRLLLAGASESLQNVVLALILLVITAVAHAIGARRHTSAS